MPFITEGQTPLAAAPSTKLPRYDVRVHDDDEAAATTFHNVSLDACAVPASSADILTAFATFVCGVTDLEAAGFVATTAEGRHLCLASITNINEPRSFSSHATTVTTVSEAAVDEQDVDYEICILGADAPAVVATKVPSPSLLTHVHNQISLDSNLVFSAPHTHCPPRHHNLLSHPLHLPLYPPRPRHRRHQPPPPHRRLLHAHHARHLLLTSTPRPAQHAAMGSSAAHHPPRPRQQQRHEPRIRSPLVRSL